MPRLQPATLANVRERIEQAALDLFVGQGCNATTTRQIAAAADMTAGALYTHYKSKEALFSAVVARYQQRLLAEDEGNPLREALRRTRFPFDIPDLAIAIRELIARHRKYWLLWYVDVLEFEGRHFRSSQAPHALLTMPELRARFDVLRTQQTLRLEPELAFTMLYMHLFNYFLVESLFRGNHHYGVTDDAAVAAIADVFLRGMLAQDDGRASRARDAR